MTRGNAPPREFAQGAKEGFGVHKRLNRDLAMPCGRHLADGLRRTDVSCLLKLHSLAHSLLCAGHAFVVRSRLSMRTWRVAGRPDAHTYVLGGCNGTESDASQRFALRSAAPVAVRRRRDIRSTGRSANSSKRSGPCSPVASRHGLRRPSADCSARRRPPRPDPIHVAFCRWRGCGSFGKSDFLPRRQFCQDLTPFLKISVIS